MDWSDAEIERIGNAAWAGREVGHYAIVIGSADAVGNLVKTVLAAAEAELEARHRTRRRVLDLFVAGFEDPSATVPYSRGDDASGVNTE